MIDTTHGNGVNGVGASSGVSFVMALARASQVPRCKEGCGAFACSMCGGHLEDSGQLGPSGGRIWFCDDGWVVQVLSDDQVIGVVDSLGNTFDGQAESPGDLDELATGSPGRVG